MSDETIIDNPLLDAISTPPTTNIPSAPPVLRDDTPPVLLETGDSMEAIIEKIGGFKMLEFLSYFNEYTKAAILNDLKQGKKYKEIGCKNFKELCFRCGISKSKGDHLVNNFRTFGSETYKSMIQIGFKEKYLKMLKNPSIDIEVESTDNKPLLKAGDYEVELKPSNKGVIEELFKQKELEIKKEKEATIKEKYLRENAEAKIKQLEKQMEPLTDDERDFETKTSKFQVRFMNLLRELHAFKELAEKTSNEGIKTQYGVFFQGVNDYFTSEIAKLWPSE